MSKYFLRRSKDRLLGLESIVSASVEGQTSGTRVNLDSSQQFQRRSKDRRLGLESIVSALDDGQTYET